MQRYPTMLYRPGSTLRVWDAHDVDTLLVHSEEEAAEAKRAGWSESPDAKRRRLSKRTA